MKKSKYKIKLSDFKNKSNTQQYFLKKEECGFSYFSEIFSIENLEDKYWVLRLEDNTKVILDGTHSIYYIKKPKSK